MRLSSLIQNSMVNHVHRIMNELIESKAEPEFIKIHSVFNKLLLNNWPADPLFKRQSKGVLYLEMALYSLYATLNSYIECARERNDDHIIAFSMILLLLFWNCIYTREDSTGIGYRIKADKLTFLKQTALDSQHDDCHDALVYMLERGAFTSVIWSRSGGDLGLIDGDIQLLLFGDSKFRKEIRKVLDEIAESLPGTNELLDGLRAQLASRFDEYEEAKASALTQSRYASKSKAWKAGLNLINSNFVATLEKLFTEVPVTRKNVKDPADKQDDDDYDDSVKSEIDNSSIVVPVPKRARINSSSSSNSSTPLQDAHDMPVL